jgi:hypothetical protein
MVALVATTIDPVFSVPPVFRSLILVRAFYVIIWLRLLLVMWSFVSRFCLRLAMMTRIVWFLVVVVVFACSHSLSTFFFVMSNCDGMCEKAERWMKHFLLLLSHFVGLSVRKCRAEVFLAFLKKICIFSWWTIGLA